MADVKSVDIAIVGGGLVGSALACLLARNAATRDLRIALIEAQQAPEMVTASGFDPRVVALTEKSRTLLDNCGVWPAVAAKRVSAYRAMEVWDAEGTGRIQFDCADVQQPNLGHIVENSVIVTALLEQVNQLENIELQCPVTVQKADCLGDQILLTLDDGSAISSKLLVAADGANSRIRQSFDFATREWDYGHSAVVTTIKTTKPNQQTAWQRFMPSGPLAFLPLNDNGDLHYSSIVWSQKTDEAERLMALDDAAFCAELSRASEHCLGDVVTVDKRYAIPLRQRHATDYVKQRVALIGDAAHTIHPLAGQGVNIGFADVAVLADEIGRAARRNLDFGDLHCLEKYQRRRKPDNLATMAAMEGFKRLFAAEAPPLRLLRNLGMSGVNQITPLKNELIRLAMGV